MAGRPKTTEETKSKRLNLLIKPSIYEAIDKIACINRTSINNLINYFLGKSISEHQNDLDRFDQAVASGFLINKIDKKNDESIDVQTDPNEPPDQKAEAAEQTKEEKQEPPPADAIEIACKYVRDNFDKVIDERKKEKVTDQTIAVIIKNGTIAIIYSRISDKDIKDCVKKLKKNQKRLHNDRNSDYRPSVYYIDKPASTELISEFDNREEKADPVDQADQATIEEKHEC